MFGRSKEEVAGDVVHRFHSPREGPQVGCGHLKVTFKLELDSKEGPSCFLPFMLCGTNHLFQETQDKEKEMYCRL